MTVVRKPWFVALSLVFALVVAVFSLTTANAAQPEASDSVKIASLVNELNGLSSDALNKLEALPIRAYEIPPAGVDVMRARLTETYSVDGVGTDQVELSGWIAVRHGQAHPVEGATELKWSTAVLSTEFVGMDLQGHSNVFGPVRVRLDGSRRSIGAVGAIQIPEKAMQVLLAAKQQNKPAKPAGKAPATKSTTTTTDTATSDQTLMCQAAANVSIEMPELKLAMQTKSPVYWYSLVTTIPPVGHTASVAIEPVRLIADGREVATLESGKVNFRELVRHERLSTVDRIETAAANK